MIKMKNKKKKDGLSNKDRRELEELTELDYDLGEPDELAD